MFVRGIPQSRQSDGNRVAKRLSATPFTDETREETSKLSLSVLVPARVMSPLLLKTNLPRPGASGGSSLDESPSV